VKAFWIARDATLTFYLHRRLSGATGTTFSTEPVEALPGFGVRGL
jgi:hypothetical protein